MKAARWHGRGDVRVDEVSEPEPGPGEVEVRVRRAGICGTDLHEVEHGPLAIPLQPHPVTGRCAPVILGHEVCGEVVATGAGVEAPAVGTRVAVDPTVACGSCWYCRRGRPVLCDRVAFLGLSADGALAEYLVAPAACAHPLPASLDDDAGALVEPFAVAVHGVRRAGIEPGDVVAVVGAGPIGVAAAQVARVCGAARVYLWETAAARRERAGELGAGLVLDPADGAPDDQLREVTGGRGVDVALDCAGAGALAVGLTRKAGRAMILGLAGGPVPFSFDELVLGEREVCSALGYAGEFPATIELLASGRLRTEGMVTARVALREVVELGFDELLDHRDRHLKLLVDPGA